MSTPVILTGLRANNDLTIGNYFGGILPMIDMATSRSDEFQINMFIPDLHSFTTPIDHDTLYEQILHTARLFVAAGLPIDDDKIHLYRQSHVPAHSELTWILDCFTGFGKLERMTQFKDKSNTLTLKDRLETESIAIPDYAKMDTDDDILKLKDDVMRLLIALKKIIADDENKLHVSAGLFNYPVLMASDILLYGATFVPVGDDQSQHLEFTRDIAERMNSRFGELFTVPESVKKQHEFFGSSRGSNQVNQGLRIKDLVDPTKKMSKSDASSKGVVFLGDDPAEAAKKIMGATTDDKAFVRYNKEEQPGISNLLEILALLRGQPLDAIIMECEGQTRYGEFKATVADAMSTFLTDFQQKLARVNDDEVLTKLAASERIMNQQANATLLRVQQAVGLRPKEL